jgi:hypothetical protein
LTFGFLAGCASFIAGDAKLQMETARIIGKIRPEQVTISNKNLDYTSRTVTWSAATPNGNYSCYNAVQTDCVKIEDKAPNR